MDIFCKLEWISVAQELKHFQDFKQCENWNAMWLSEWKITDLFFFANKAHVKNQTKCYEPKL